MRNERIEKEKSASYKIKKVSEQYFEVCLKTKETMVLRVTLYISNQEEGNN